MKRAFYAGLTASLAAGVVMLAFRLVTGGLTVPEAMVDAVTAIVPLHIFSATLEALGAWAKRLLVVGLTLGLFLGGGLVGTAWYWARNRIGAPLNGRHRTTAVVLGLVLWLTAMFLLLPASRRGAFALSVSPWPAAMVFSWLASTMAFALVLEWLARVPYRPVPSSMGTEQLPTPVLSPSSQDNQESSRSRRDFIRRLGWTAAGIALAAGAGVTVWRMVASLSSRAIRTLSGEALPAEVTPNKDFYEVSKNLSDPSVDISSWKLLVSGLVEHPLEMDYQQLKDMQSVEQYQTLECISNPVGGPLISNARWKGVRLRDLLIKAGVKASAIKVVLSSADEYQDSITLSKAMEPGTVLAYEMNGVPLPEAHGFPARLLVPDIYGMKNVKWLTRIELVDYDFKGYWQKSGWSDIATIDTMSRIDVPSLGYATNYDLVEEATLGGVAFTGARGISRVEISADDGNTWTRAKVKEALSPYTWVLWTYDWRPPADGTFTLVVRATDGKGEVQTAEERDSLPDGATGYHKVTIRLIKPPAPPAP